MSVDRDERTVAVENASYKWGYLVMSFGLLVLVAYRSFAHGESNWDLLALVIAGGMVPNAYQGVNSVLTRRWTMTQIAAMAAAAILAAAFVLLRR